MMADPDINKTASAELADTHRLRQYAYENCDACEAESYKIGRTMVSDFVLHSGSSLRAPRVLHLII